MKFCFWPDMPARNPLQILSQNKISLDFSDFHTSCRETFPECNAIKMSSIAQAVKEIWIFEATQFALFRPPENRRSDFET